MFELLFVKLLLGQEWLFNNYDLALDAMHLRGGSKAARQRKKRELKRRLQLYNVLSARDVHHDINEKEQIIEGKLILTPTQAEGVHEHVNNIVELKKKKRSLMPDRKRGKDAIISDRLKLMRSNSHQDRAESRKLAQDAGLWK